MNLASDGAIHCNERHYPSGVGWVNDAPNLLIGDWHETQLYKECIIKTRKEMDKSNLDTTKVKVAVLANCKPACKAYKMAEVFSIKGLEEHILEFAKAIKRTLIYEGEIELWVDNIIENT